MTTSLLQDKVSRVHLGNPVGETGFYNRFKMEVDWPHFIGNFLGGGVWGLFFYAAGNSWKSIFKLLLLLTLHSCLFCVAKSKPSQRSLELLAQLVINECN